MTGNVAKGFPDVRSLMACYQTCYHFPEKAARARMNQGPIPFLINVLLNLRIFASRDDFQV